MRTPSVVAALRSIAFAPDDVIDGVDLAVAVEIAGLGDDQGAGIQQKGAGNSPEPWPSSYQPQPAIRPVSFGW
jgi:hypothetical protein